ncbi:MAG TPA: shikimate kinase [Nocardioides sp.]|uniref:shikimate kinase n=1 Tax=Nocardioides sp. TaxID=35761 RepID=UPI002ED8FA42
MRPRVVLVGPMGAGKSTVGSLLAERWGVTVRDTDTDIEAVAGKPVSDIFVEDGEAAFRTLERQAVAAALATHDGVLALGGGAVLDPGTRELLHGHRVVYLRVGLADAVKRVGLGTGRPLLLGDAGGIRARVRQLLDERAPVYEAVATEVVDTDGRSPAEVADLIEEELT